MSRTFLIYFPTYFYSLVAIFIQVFLPTDCIALNRRILEISYHSVATCIVKISEKELFWKPTVALVIEKNLTENKREFFNEMLKKLNEWEKPFITEDVMKNETLDVSKANYMVINYFKSCEDIVKFNFKNLDKYVKYLIILESISECSLYIENFGNIFGKFDISFFVKNRNDDWDLYTYIPDIDYETCKVVIRKPYKINTCSNGRLTGSVAFPSKVTTNFRKCPFKIGLTTLYPFALIENKDSLQAYDRLNIHRLKGMDVEIIKIMSDRFNASLELYNILKEEENPTVPLKYLSLLLNGSLEACIGGMYRIYGDLVEYSGIYASQSVKWIYSAERVKKTWENMALSIDGLYLFIVFYLSYSVVWCLICAFDKNSVSLKNTMLYAWGALVGTSTLQDAKTFKQRVLNIVYLNMSLHLSVYIGIQLYAFLTTQGPPEMLKTNEDIMKSGRTPFLRSLAKYFVKDEKYELFANTSMECTSIPDCAQQSLLHRGVTVYVSGHFYPFQAATAVNDEARMLSAVENIITVYNEMIIRKESPVVLKFQKTIVRLFEAGITEKLFLEAIGLTVVGKAKIAAKNMAARSYACQMGCKINLQQFYGVFYVWGIGCAASVCLFVMEILIQKRGNFI